MINHLSNAWNFQLGWFVHLEVPVGLVCQFHLALERKKYDFPFALDGTCLGPNRLLPDGLSTYLGRPKGLELRKDTWREASHNAS